METLLSAQFWLLAIAFVLITFVIFFIPGILILLRIKVTHTVGNIIAWAPAVGIILWGFQGYIFGYLQFRAGTYLYLVLLLLATFHSRDEVVSFFHQAWKQKQKASLTTLSLILLGVGIQCFQMFGSGLMHTDGIRFFRINAYDGIYHLNLIQSIVREFPPMEPGAAGLSVVNYHYWSDLVIAEIVRIFGIPASFIFFQFFPIFISFWTGLALVALLKSCTKLNNLAIGFALLFTYLAGDIGFLLSYHLHKTFSVDIPVIDNGATQFLNMPHAVAKMLFVSVVPIFFTFIQKRTLSIGILAMCLSASLFGFKVYFGIYIAIGILSVFIYTTLFTLIKQKKISIAKEFILGVMFLLMTAMIYLPVNAGAGGLTYVPLAWPRLMLAPDKLDNTDWNYRYAIYQSFNNTKGLLYLNIIAIIYCLLAIHGTRVFGFFLSKKTWTELGSSMLVFFLPSTLLFTLLGLFTLQVSGGFNVFNFFAVTMTFLAISSGALLGRIWTMRFFVGKVLVGIILAISVQRSVVETLKIARDYRANTDSRTITKDELAAYRYLATQTDYHAVVQPDSDMYDYPISYYSNRSTYFTTIDVLKTHNLSTQERESQMRSMIRTDSPSHFSAQMKEYKISYLLVRKIHTQGFQLAGKPGIKTVYENDNYAVYTVDEGK